MSSTHNITAFFANRSWGVEYLMYVVPNSYSIKLLQINKGFAGGLQKHHLKHEIGYLLEGSLRVTTIDNEFNPVEYTLKEGSLFSFPPGLYHQEEALTDVFILEASTPHFNDRVRIDSDSINALPSTSVSDVFCISSADFLLDIQELGFKPISISDIPFFNRILFFS